MIKPYEGRVVYIPKYKCFGRVFDSRLAVQVHMESGAAEAIPVSQLRPVSRSETKNFYRRQYEREDKQR